MWPSSRRAAGRMLWVAVGLAVSGAMSALWSVANAQSVSIRAAGPKTLSGIVTDTLGMAIADVDVYITRLQRRTRTLEDGTFLFDDIKPGTYQVGARGLGYVAQSYRVVVGDNGGTVQITMLRFAVALPSMVTVVERTGLSGVIGDTGYVAMGDVAVQILGKDNRTVSDSTGNFHLDIKPGRYMVELTRPGFVRQLIGVTIPSNGGRRIAAWMVPELEKPNPLIGANVFEMKQRLMRASPVWAKFYTREDMAKLGMTEVRQAASMFAMKIVNPDCPVLIDGGPRQLPVWQIAAGDVEFVEVYLSKPARKDVRSINPDGTTGSGPAASTSLVPPSVCAVSIIAWMRH